jgi:hypothetical protein
VTQHYCTYFDRYYLLRGLTMFQSLFRQSDDFALHVLCFDEEVLDTIDRLSLPNLRPMKLGELEAAEPRLLGVKSSRSRLEYFYTCTPSLPLRLLRTHPEIDAITYLDADLFFYADPRIVTRQFEDHSILLIELRHPPAWEKAFDTQQYGTYNVGFLSFRNDAKGKACLEWWQDRCIEWCSETPEDGRFADQKYLDQWPSLFENVLILKNKGANLAFWNWENYQVTRERGVARVDDEPLIFCHISRLKQISRWLFALNFNHPFTVPWSIRRACFAPYLATLQETDRWLRQSVPAYRPTYRDLRSDDNDWRRILASFKRRNLMLSCGSYAL